MELGPVVVLGDVEALCFPESLMGRLGQTESAALCFHSVCTKQTSFGLWFRFQTSSMFYNKCIMFGTNLVTMAMTGIKCLCRCLLYCRNTTMCSRLQNLTHSEQQGTTQEHFFL